MSYVLLLGNHASTVFKIFKDELSAKDVLESMPIALELDIHYYFLNCISRGKVHAPMLSYYKNMMMPQVMRNLYKYAPYIKNAGWHLSYMGGIDRIKKKLASIVEGNLELVNDKYIKDCLNNGKDLYGRTGREFRYDFVDKSDLKIPYSDEFIEKYPQFYYEKK